MTDRVKGKIAPPDEANANAEALRRICLVEPAIAGVMRASALLPELGPRDLLHAGPPLRGWSEACGALRGAVVGRALCEGWARDIREANDMAVAGEFHLKSANDHGVLGTFAGVISRDTPLIVVEDRASGSRAAAAINEGRGKAVRYGSTDEETLVRLKWLEGPFADMIGSAISRAGGIEVMPIVEQALHMGDECHSRQKAASSLFANAIAAPLVEGAFPAKDTARALRFLAANEIFFLPIAIAAAKVAMKSGEGVECSTVVTCMAANGVRFGIQVSALPGKWFTAPVPAMEGKFFPGNKAADAGPLIGDSLVSETLGLGAFAMAGAPALAPYVGGTPEQATSLARAMYDVAVAEHPRYRIPALGYRGTPFGIDARRVVSTGITPIFNAGMAHRDAGVGQIGAGFGRAPMECFEAVLAALA